MDDRQPRITIAHSMEVSYTTLDAQAGLSYDTTIRLTVDPMGMYLDPQACACCGSRPTTSSRA